MRLIILLLFLTSCARFSTTQTDRSYTDAKGNEIREITTKATSTTFFESRSSLANFKATQTDHTQTAIVGSLNQDANATNLVKMAEAAAEGAVKAMFPNPKSVLR